MLRIPRRYSHFVFGVIAFSSASGCSLKPSPRVVGAEWNTSLVSRRLSFSVGATSAPASQIRIQDSPGKTSRRTTAGRCWTPQLSQDLPALCDRRRKESWDLATKIVSSPQATVQRS